MISISSRKMAGDTHAVILAAGIGSRLKHNTEALPKCLVPVAGTPMLEHMFDALRELGFGSVTVVVGYLDELIEQFIKRYQTTVGTTFEVKTIRNDSYAVTGSVCSLNLALDAVRSTQHVLVIEGDVVLERALLVDLVDAARESAGMATLLAPYEACLSGTFATVDDGFVSAWLHESVRPFDFDLSQSFKTVNLTFAPRDVARRSLSTEVRRAIERFGPKAPLEYAMHRLVGNGVRIAAVPTRGLKWFEVDTPEDLAIANGLFGEHGRV